MINEILVISLIAVGCPHHEQNKECTDYVAKCYRDGLQAPEVQQYEIEYRKAVVIESCIRKANGKDGMQAK